MMLFNKIKKIFRKRTVSEVKLEESINRVSDQFSKDCPDDPLSISGGGAIGPGRGQPPPVLYGNAPQPNVIFTSSAILQESPPSPRARNITAIQAEQFCERLDFKISKLINIKLKTTNIQERESLTTSIDILEMTRELVKEVFLELPKDENT